MPGKEYRIEDFDQVLVVEGYSDLLFYAEVLEALGKHDRVFIKELGGKKIRKENLENLITPTLLRAKTAIGVVVDANDKPDEPRRSLETVLSQVTGQQVVEGKWTTGKPRIGFLIVPGGAMKGEIETLVWQSWANDPANGAQKKCVEDYVACMKSNGREAHSPDKGLIGTLLAVRYDEDPRLGPGARAKVFDLNRPELKPLRDFLSGF